MDPRFAELLGGRESSSARQVIQAPEQPTSGQNQATTLIAEMARAEGEAGAGSQRGDSGFFSQRGEIFQAASQPAGQETGQTFSFENVRPTATPTPQAAATTGAEVKLPSGQVVPDSHILDQVIEKAALHNTRDRNSLTMRLHPEELGELRLELVLEKGALRAHVHAQSHQVQEVLERNMFRLREALEQHGLRLDEVEVSVDDGREGQEKDLWQRQQQERFAAPGKPGARNGLPAEAVQMANPQPKASSGGINLRV
jgi:flagellar hook-length control protein FliK